MSKGSFGPTFAEADEHSDKAAEADEHSDKARRRRGRQKGRPDRDRDEMSREPTGRKRRKIPGDVR